MTEPYELSIGQAAEILGFSIQSVRKWAEDGKLTGLRTPAPGNRWRFRRSDLEEFIEQNRTRSEASA